MPIFKDKAKKLLAEMRQVRNRGTCTFVAEKTEEENEFISHVQQVLGYANGEDSKDVSEDCNNNEIPRKNISSSTSSTSFAAIVEEKMRQVSLNKANSDHAHGHEHENEHEQEEDENSNSIDSVSSYNDNPELLITTFKQKWMLSSDRSISNTEKTIKDFFVLKTIGRGAFGKVLLTQCRATGHYHAIKVIEKAAVIEKEYVDGVVNEKRILMSVQHPFLVQLTMHFKDSQNLYFVMEWVSGGDLFFHLRRRHRFSEKEAQFYGGQIALALEYLHVIGIVYRDLKPENILINNDGYIKLTDFGLAKPLSKIGRTNTMLGTAEYLAPEIFLQKPYGKSIDSWAFGILLYEMVHGQSPFRSESEAETYEKVMSGKIKFGYLQIQITNQLKHLIINLLQDDAKKRYGSESWNDVKTHPWFGSLNWKALLNKRIEPPFVPKLHHRGDTRFFDQYKDSHTEFLHSKIHADTYHDFFDDF